MNKLLTCLGLSILLGALGSPGISAPGFSVSAVQGAEPVSGRPFFFALSVADAEKSSQWYERVLGFERARAVDLEARGLRIRLMRREGAFLELTEIEGAKGLQDLSPPIARRFQVHGVFKFGFLVENLDRTLSRLAALEVDLRGRVITEEDGSMRSLQVEDPDGNVIQIFERATAGGPERSDERER